LITPRDLSEKARNEFLRALDRAEMGSWMKSSSSLPPLISQLAMMQAFGVAG
jgi:hypothetical protein